MRATPTSGSVTSVSFKNLSEHIALGGSLCVYGAGSAGSDLIELVQSLGLPVAFVLDAKSRSTEMRGVPVHAPTDLRFESKLRSRTWILIGIFNPAVDVSLLRQDLLTQGWGLVSSFLDVHAGFHSELGNRYWLTRRDFYDDFSTEISRARALLKDDKSRAIFEGTLRLRTLGDDSGLREPDFFHQYFPKDLLPLQQRLSSTTLRLVDCGACVGDTVKHIRKEQYPVDALYLFEPDPKNYQNLVAELRNGPLPPNGAQVFPCGVSSRFETLRFSSSKGAASAFAQSGDIQVTCVSLDDTLAGCRPNFIKMDVEGAELAALRGGRRLIETNRPILAISAYHQPKDLWEIAHLIEGWDLGYDFYLRQHMFTGFDLVLYGIPRK
ncbi:MAG: FkbM family methyltransferase [Oligoflexia bacterium]